MTDDATIDDDLEDQAAALEPYLEVQDGLYAIAKAIDRLTAEMAAIAYAVAAGARRTDRTEQPR